LSGRGVMPANAPTNVCRWSLALLAVGAAGVAAWRARKKKQPVT